MTTNPEPARCPFTGQVASTPLTHQPTPPAQSIARDERGFYRVQSFGSAREVLRSEQVKQAGFMAEVASSAPGLERQPVLYAEGEHHHEMRRSTARYFTPTGVEGYGPFIARFADGLIARLMRGSEVKLDDLSLDLAVNVAAQVVGLTNSRLPGMSRRVMAFVSGGGDSAPGQTTPGGRLEGWRQYADVVLFYLLDVKPAIQARRRERGDDLISHLLDRGYNDAEILTECLTYGTAGMVTTREFISVAAWHLLQNPDLRGEYVHGTERERHAILHEILRLEPVVSTLYRRAEEDLTVNGQTVPRGSVIALDIQTANMDPAVVGEDPTTLCPARPLPRGVTAPVLSFGDGHHRCPGAFLAIKESDVFLRRLLVWNDLEVVSGPEVSRNEVVKGYELRNFRIRLGRPGSARPTTTA
ncbi:cytochrome P450 [Deinococcus hopiensis]|uniref:Cytochrome P450 n=1 Tax=Deinococcus hopiensis KR-140 TaxID=695939 RepID=A0A1W1V5B6_9DEIO|nr:cytochrome P450 [Deinococcus hopiensis]SMB88639.1 Cytochrome P450 [Deinococcus hopiensis KR-140]